MSYLVGNESTVYCVDTLDHVTCHITCTHDPAPPTGISVVAGIESGTADVSWSSSIVVYSGAIGNYSVRCQQRSDGDYTTVNSTSTSVTLQGLNRSLEYVVDVTAID